MAERGIGKETDQAEYKLGCALRVRHSVMSPCWKEVEGATLSCTICIIQGLALCNICLLMREKYRYYLQRAPATHIAKPFPPATHTLLSN
jgi:hypothetical protein